MKKISILSLLPAILLMSCGEFKPYGHYQFRLGKTDGSHLELDAELSEEQHETQEGFKKLKLTADLGNSMSPAAIIEQYESDLEESLPAEIVPFVEPLIEILTSEIKNMDHIDGFYKLTNLKHEKYGYKVDIGSDILVTYLKNLAAKYEGIKDIIDLFGITDQDVTFMPDVTRNIFSAYVNKKAFTIQIPVSMDDLNMQMFWYGKSSVTLDENYIDKMPGVKGEERFGTHPKYVSKNGVVTVDEVAEVNRTFEKEFSNTFIYEDDMLEAGERLGTLVETEVNGVKQLKIYLVDDYEGSRSNITGYIDVQGTTQEMKFSLDDKNFTNCVSNGKTGKDAGFTDENGTEFTFKKLMKDPFVFRDFHVVNVGLSKVVD